MDSPHKLETAISIRVAPEHTLMQRLAERRITPEVIATFQIEPRGQGWVYPTQSGALRFKNANSEASNKYAWIGERRDTLLYGFDLQEAIQMTGGEVWLTTEFDFFAMRSAGIFHTIAQMQGEGSVPDELPALLQSMGTLVCNIAPDRDDQGRAWAQLVADKLIPAGIEVYARELPYPHKQKHGGDVGRLWQEYNRSQPFERYLMRLPTSLLKATAKEESKPRPRYDIAEDRRAQIAHLLGVERYQGNGYSKSIRCPFHDDKKPSAGLHREFGFHCFKCGWKRWKDLAEHFGLDWVTHSAPTAPNQTLLGDELRYAMIQAGCSSLAYTLEAMYRAGWQVGQTFTPKQINALVSRRCAKRAFAQMEGKGEDKRVHNKGQGAKGKERQRALCTDLTSFFLLHKEALILHKKLVLIATLPHPSDLARAYGVTVTRYTSVEWKQNLADWRAEVYAIPIDRDPGSYPRKELCQPLGISTTTAQAYDKRAGVSVTHRKSLPVVIESADELPETPKLKAVWLETENGQKFRATKSGFERAQKQAINGKVYKVKQLANSYKRKSQP